MGSTYASLLNVLVEFRDRQFRNEPDREEARIDMLESTLQAVLEKLRDQFDRR
jgi:hypothetical protein